MKVKWWSFLILKGMYFTCKTKDIKNIEGYGDIALKYIYSIHKYLEQPFEFFVSLAVSYTITHSLKCFKCCIFVNLNSFVCLCFTNG